MLINIILILELSKLSCYTYIFNNNINNYKKIEDNGYKKLKLLLVLIGIRLKELVLITIIIEIIYIKTQELIFTLININLNINKSTL